MVNLLIFFALFRPHDPCLRCKLLTYGTPKFMNCLGPSSLRLHRLKKTRFFLKKQLFFIQNGRFTMWLTLRGVGGGWVGEGSQPDPPG